jgi:hypothetical protein
VGNPPYSAAEVDAAVQALAEPERLAHAQQIVVHAAPALQQILSQALNEGGWFGDAHESALAQIAGESDAAQRTKALDAMIAEQTRLGMFVGVAVGFELASELLSSRAGATPKTGKPTEEH